MSVRIAEQLASVPARSPQPVRSRSEPTLLNPSQPNTVSAGRATNPARAESREIRQHPGRHTFKSAGPGFNRALGVGGGGVPLRRVYCRLARPAPALSPENSRHTASMRPQSVRSSFARGQRLPTTATPWPATFVRGQRGQRRSTPRWSRSHRVGQAVAAVREARRARNQSVGQPRCSTRTQTVTTSWHTADCR